MKLMKAVLVALPLICLVPAAQGQTTGSVEGVVLVGGEPLGGVTVDVHRTHYPWWGAATTTDDEGAYSFAGVPSGEVQVWIGVPLGYYDVLPEGGSAIVTVPEDSTVTVTVDFEVALIPGAGEARGLGYWKHQASALYHGLPNAQESGTQLEGYREDLSAFNVMSGGPIDFYSFYPWAYCGWPCWETEAWSSQVFYHVFLEAPQGPDNLVKGKLQLLVLFLNVVSNRLHPADVISQDGATVSQAIQQLTTQLLDGDPANDEAAKDLAETINSGRQVGAGVIDLELHSVVYTACGWYFWCGPPRPSPAALSFSVAPNPMIRSGTVTFELSSPGHTSVRVFDVEGRLVRTLVDRELLGGSQSVVWNGRSDSGELVANGVYFYRIDGPDGLTTAPFVVMRR